MYLTFLQLAEVFGRTDHANSRAPFIAQLVEMIKPVSYYTETSVKPVGISTKFVHVTRQPSQVPTRLDVSAINDAPGEVFATPFSRVIRLVGIIVTVYDKISKIGIGIGIHIIYYDFFSIVNLVSELGY
jgi:hypothetical protein